MVGGRGSGLRVREDSAISELESAFGARWEFSPAGDPYAPIGASLGSRESDVRCAVLRRPERPFASTSGAAGSDASVVGLVRPDVDHQWCEAVHHVRHGHLDDGLARRHTAPLPPRVLGDPGEGALAARVVGTRMHGPTVQG